MVRGTATEPGVANLRPALAVAAADGVTDEVGQITWCFAPHRFYSVAVLTQNAQFQMDRSVFLNLPTWISVAETIKRQIRAAYDCLVADHSPGSGLSLRSIGFKPAL